VTEALLIVALVFGPLAHGCTEQWSLPVLQILLLSLTLFGRREPRGPGWSGAFLLGPALFILLLGTLQWLHPVPMDGLSSCLPFTASQRETGKALVLWAGFCCLLWAGPRMLSKPGAKERLGWALVLIAVLVAVVGMIQLSQGNTLVYGLRKAAYNRSPFGPYFNRGHAASLMAVCLAAGMGLLASRQASRGRRLDQGMRPSDFFASQATLAMLLAVIGAGIVLARNRGAVLGLALACAGVGFWACGFLRSWSGRWALRTFLVLLPMALAAAIMHWPEALGFPNGLGENSVTWRAGMYSGAWRLFADFPVWGSGLGAVLGAFPGYKPSVVAGVVDHVHSDWLELLLQVGVVGTLAVLAGLLAMVVRFWKRSRELSSEELFLEAGALGGVLAFMAHSAIEFSFQIPANAVVFLTLLCWLAVERPRDEEGGEERTERQRHAPGWQVWGVRTLVLGLMLASLYPVIGYGYALKAMRRPPSERFGLLEKSYRWDPDPVTAYELGFQRIMNADKHPKGRTAALREGLAFTREALRREPLNPFLTRLQGTFLSGLGRQQDADPMLSVRP
jgi:O-antigen ligase